MASIKKYNGSSFENAAIRKYSTASEIITPPTTIYADGSPITAYTLKGNTVQNGTPTPSAPIAVQSVGELDSGQYKIPISSGQQTTNIYLSEPLRKFSNDISAYIDSYTETLTRFVKKIIIDGNSSITNEGGNAPFRVAADGLLLQTTPQMRNTVYWYCSHYPAYPNSASWAQYDNLISWSSNDTDYLRIRDTRFATLADFKNWLQQQSDNGTPVTIWYVLATPTTESVTAPSIPTIQGANSITVDTTVQPSEFTAAWTGWHDSSVKEWDGTQWNE